MPEKLGNPYKKSTMLTPLGAEPGKKDPGPPVNNNPIVAPDDTLGFVKPLRKTSEFKHHRGGDGADMDRP